MNIAPFFKAILVFGLILFSSQAFAQASIEHDGGFITDLNRVYQPREEIDQYPAALTLAIGPKTNTYVLTVTPEKGEPFTFAFNKPTQKEKCGSLIGTGKKTASAVKFKVSGLDCKIPHPTITIRDENKEFMFHLTEEGNLQAVSELRKVWVKK